MVQIKNRGKENSANPETSNNPMSKTYYNCRKKDHFHSWMQIQEERNKDDNNTNMNNTNMVERGVKEIVQWFLKYKWLVYSIWQRRPNLQIGGLIMVQLSMYANEKSLFKTNVEGEETKEVMMANANSVKVLGIRTVKVH